MRLLRLLLLGALIFTCRETGAGATEDGVPDCCRANINELVAKLKSGDQHQRWEALSKLGLYGAEAASAVPELARHLSVKTDEYRTIHTLGQIGPPAKTAVPDLVLILNGALNNTDKFSPETTLSVNVITALSNIREHEELIVPVLRKALDHPYATIRYEAAHALGAMGKTARPAVGDLKKLVTDTERPPLYVFPYGNTVGDAAKDALEHIQPVRR